MSQVTISFGFPEGVDYEAHPNLTTSVLTGTPQVGDLVHFGEKARFAVEGRAWVIRESGTELHIKLKALSSPG